jgi:protein involved in polysaccharide export with SLBB domain
MNHLLQKITVLVSLPLVMACLAGCLTTKSAGYAHPLRKNAKKKSAHADSTKTKQAVPSPAPQNLTFSNTTVATTDSARLRPGLVINVNVLVSGKKEIEAVGKRITDKGTIAIPLLGTVIVNDLTLEDLSVQLTEAYKEYFVNPQVIVDFMRDDNKEGLSPWGNVTVLGRVKKPGRISLPATRDLTLSGAIQQAGGFDTSAKESAIRITRRLPGGGVKTWEIDLHSVGAKGRIEDDIILEPDDVVFVPELIF